MLEALSQPPFDSPDDTERLHRYLLLESEALEDYLRILPDAPDRPSACDSVKQLDYCVFARWVWSGTEYERHETRGPLLVQYGLDSPLPEVFRDEWAAHDAGLLLTSEAPMDEVLDHLRRILFIQLPDGIRARFRIQEPLALTSVLQALSPERAAVLLGPLQEIVWRENTGPTYQWWRYRRSAACSGIAGFGFSQAEMLAIDAGLAEHFLRTQTALTERLVHQTYDDPRQQVLDWISQLESWGWHEREDIVTGLDIFRHPRFPQYSEILFAILRNSERAVSVRIASAQDHLYAQGV